MIAIVLTNNFEQHCIVNVCCSLDQLSRRASPDVKLFATSGLSETNETNIYFLWLFFLH